MLGDGPVIDLDYEEEVGMLPYQYLGSDKAGLEIIEGMFANNTSHGKAALFVLDLDLPWLRIKFYSTTISGNVGMLSNDFYVKNIRRLDFLRSLWK
jgi:hypothetical protein